MEYSEELQNHIIELYNSGLSGIKIAKIIKKCKNSVYKVIKTKFGSCTQFKISQDEKNCIIKLYKDGLSCQNIAIKFNVSVPSVRSIIKNSGLELRHKRLFFDSNTENLIVDMYNSGKFKKDIAKKLEVDIRTINYILTKYNINHTKANSGCRHGNWKGGSTTSTGYNLIHVDINDPFFIMADNNGYILEHRYNMAKYLGRSLEKFETVHHIDGNKKNNNIKNLQLRHGKHGKGQRFICCNCGSNNIKAIKI